MIPPTPGEGFEWREVEGRPVLVCRALDAVAPHLFTTAGWPTGASRPGGDAGEAWAAVAAALGVEPAALTRLRQVHGAACALARAAAGGGADPLPEADIVLVGEPGLAGAIQVADCVPILLADPSRGVVAAAHAGWRGLAAGVPRVAVEGLHTRFGTRPGDLVAALGPSIGACCYEVGVEVRARFEAERTRPDALARWFLEGPAEVSGNPTMPRVREGRRTPDHWFFDGWAAARDQLIAAGLDGARIFSARLCTASHPGWFCSYRRDGAPAGRLVAAIRCPERERGGRDRG
ncbi:MAG: polyphenol oxidase family protein [Vicinamibacterales bacterium]